MLQIELFRVVLVYLRKKKNALAFYTILLSEPADYSLLSFLYSIDAGPQSPADHLREVFYRMGLDDKVNNWEPK